MTRFSPRYRGDGVEQVNKNTMLGNDGVLFYSYNTTTVTNKVIQYNFIFYGNSVLTVKQPHVTKNGNKNSHRN